MADDDECAINKITSNDTYYQHENEEDEIQFDDENTGTEITITQETVENEIQIETPMESHAVSMTTVSNVEASNVKPKRLSDEFSSLDEEVDDIDEEEENVKLSVAKCLDVACCSKSSSILENDNDVTEEESSSNPPFLSDKAETSSCISLCFSNSSNNLFVQSIDDAIERSDFESEQKLTGGIIIRASSLVKDNDRLNFDLLNTRRSANKSDEIDPTPSVSQENITSNEKAETSAETNVRNEITSTPTSSRCNANDIRNKSTIRSSSAKQKLSDKYLSIKNVTVTGSSMTDYDNGESSKSICIDKVVDQSEHSSKRSSGGSASIIVDKSVKINLFDDEPSTSSGSTNRRHNHHNSLKDDEEAIESLKLNDDFMDNTNHDLSDDLDPEDTWADCEDGGSDCEEICTCRNDSDEEYGASSSSSEDELPSRDVDLSSYTQLDPISDLQDTGCDGTPKIQRKRKLTEQSMLHVASESPITSGGNRKRLALETISSPLTNIMTPISSQNLATPKSSSSLLVEKRTPRLIPTKENPPPELMEWLLTFQRWTNAERLVAVDKLIEQCEPTQVRFMMKVIEPQFQRDFISLLPKELALHVLAYLEPKDLLRAAQTCRSWRFLADDNLLWKEKCKQAGIISDACPDRPKRGRTGNMPKIASPWKAAYMRHHTIEMNWRTNPIRTPKILNGHDDHVITCLQFSGNRIVSGSDDNTLKVWSAVTGKCLRTLVGHTGGVWSSQMSGNLIISGSTDRTLKVWDAETGTCKHTLYGHTSTVRCMHLHGKKVVSGSRDATLRVWDINDGTCLHILVGHLAAVRCVQYDGKLVVSGAYDYQVKVWNPERQECLHTLQGHTNRVYSLQFDGVHVVSGSLDTSIRVWDAETGALRHTLMGHQSLTSGMELKNNILVSGNADSTVKVWDIITGQCLATLAGRNKHHSAVTCLQFNNRFVITSSDDGTVKLWDVKTGEFIRNLVALDSGGSGGVVWRIRANDTKLICAVGSRNGTEETKLMVLDFDVEGACTKCS
ncbi:F-box/WD repeat-containing protein 7 [Chironomus tepperi]|uniref:F-box/WD repeat-containing protein 7 n=1 Tax=Chironomus tepperi TaxID=113505 RepID=UPI00391EFCC8